MEVIANISGWHWLAVSVLALLASVFFGVRFLRSVAAAAYLLALMLAFVYVDLYRQLLWGTGFLLLALFVQAWIGRKHLPQNATRRMLSRKRRLLGQRASVLALQTQKQGRVQLRDAIWTIISDRPLRLGELVEVQGVSGAQLKVSPCTVGGKEAAGQA